MPEFHKVGLVLSGGGAKGAYQVGVLKALVEFNVPVHVISGASIGALNGAVLASAPNLETGTQRLEQIWLELANDSPLKHHIPGYLKLLLAAGLQENVITTIAKSIITVAQRNGLPIPEKVHQAVHGRVMDDTPLKKLIEQYIDQKALMDGIPFYVSVFKSTGGLMDIARIILDQLSLLSSPDSEFIHLQSKPESERKELLLASAAIPIAFAPRQVNGNLYSDGGQGGWSKAQGNTPISPLIDEGCDVVIVTHLSDGSPWSRHDFPDTTIVEIRPQSNIARHDGMSGGFKDLLGFDESNITSWINQGYLDTKHSIDRIVQAERARSNLKDSEKALADMEKNRSTADKALSDALARLE